VIRQMILPVSRCGPVVIQLLAYWVCKDILVGLGLSVSYNITQKHHGRIEVESEFYKGITFRIYLPVNLKEKKGKG